MNHIPEVCSARVISLIMIIIMIIMINVTCIN